MIGLPGDRMIIVDPGNNVVMDKKTGGVRPLQAGELCTLIGTFVQRGSGKVFSRIITDDGGECSLFSFRIKPVLSNETKYQDTFWTDS